MKKRVLRTVGSGFTYGAVVGVFLFLMNTPPDANFMYTLKVLLAAAIVTAVCGIVFSGILLIADRIRAKKFDPFRKELEGAEPILLEDYVRRTVGEKEIRGFLFLTGKHLYFKSKTASADRILSLADVESVQISDPKKCRITVTLTSGETDIFTVSDPLPWFHQIGDLKTE